MRCDDRAIVDVSIALLFVKGLVLVDPPASGMTGAPSLVVRQHRCRMARRR